MEKRKSKPLGEVDTALFSDEKKAIWKFITFYLLSFSALLIITSILYYNHEMFKLQEKCSIEMENEALMIKQDLMNAKLEKEKYHFKAHSKDLKAGLFSAKKEVIFSNLVHENIPLSIQAYKKGIHEYHVTKLNEPIFNISYVVIENSQGYSDKIKLIIKILTIFFILAFAIGCVGLYLSKLVIKPIKTRVERLNDFIKDSAHELNTPISALMMSVSSLKQNSTIDKKTLNHISISSKLISEIYNTLSFHAFHDRDIILDEAFDLSILIQESISFFEEIAISKGIFFTCKLESTLIKMDKSRAKKLINNLLSNAIKYGYKKSEVKVMLENRVLSITNESDGISLGDKKEVFQRYKRASKNAGGFGIGLNIVKNICTHYNIAIDLHSTPKKTTTFTLSFPKSLSVKSL